MKKTLIVAAVFLSVFWAAASWAQLKDGLWEITTQVQIQGMNQQMPPSTIRQCMTKSDPVVKNQDKNFECRTLSQKTVGNTVNYSVACTGQAGEMQTTGQSTYTGTAMDGSAKTSFKMKGQPAMQMVSKMSGKYVGPCPK